ncbi:carboxypeptidase-like regulatory domain-containing protein [Silvibacterium dinghuense]|nr:carboxypeptidase-like regulatory domain-containing protein [Silvibacterium dinghuense]
MQNMRSQSIEGILRMDSRGSALLASVPSLLGIGILCCIVLACPEVWKVKAHLSEKRAISGVVMDAGSHRPLGGALVWIEEEKNRTVSTDSSGLFALFPNNAAHFGQTVTVHAKEPGYQDERLQIKIGKPSHPFSLQLPDDNAAYSFLRSPQYENASGVHTNQALICHLDGESPAGGVPWKKEDACYIPRVEDLDTTYREGSMSSSKGGVYSPMKLADLPPGIEMRISGYHDWAISDVQLTHHQLSFFTHCEPEISPGPGCSVRVEVIAHYKTSPQN